MAMRVWIVVALSFCGTGQSPASAEAPRAPLPGSARAEPDSFRQLEAEAQKLHPGLTSEEAVRLVQENFRNLYANRVKEQRFLVKPSAERIAARTAELIRLNHDLAGLLARGRRMVVTSPPSHSGRERSQQRTLIQEIGGTSRKIRDMFRDYFLDLNDTPFRFTLASKGDGAFRMFLLEAGRIQRQLHRELGRYFLGSRPGVVSVQEFGQPSVPVMAEALVQLSKLSQERISE